MFVEFKPAKNYKNYKNYHYIHLLIFKKLNNPPINQFVPTQLPKKNDCYFLIAL